MCEEAEAHVVQPLRRSTRVRKDPSSWKETRVYFNSQAVAHPVHAVCSLAHNPTAHQAFITSINQEYIPRSYVEAMELKEWKDSVGDEISAMIKNDT